MIPYNSYISLFKKIQKAFILSCSFLLSINHCTAQLEPLSKPNDTAILLQSHIMPEARSIWIHLPSDYKTASQPYPVLYLLDGDGHFNYVAPMTDYLSDMDRNACPEMIVVAIVNVDRGRDLTPRHPKEQSDSIVDNAGAGLFLQFIQKELIPYIEDHYRTQPYRILMGHSLAGQFALYAKVKASSLFQANILVSPAVHDVNDNLINRFSSLLAANPSMRNKMFITLGNENPNKTDQLANALTNHASAVFNWDYKKYPDENHFSVTNKSIFDGLKFIYKTWHINFYDTARYAYRFIQHHFDALSKEFGYAIEPGETFINTCGYVQLRLGNVDDAIDIFKKNIEKFPNSFNVYDSMGEAYMAKGDKKKAIAYYEKSVELNPGNEGGKEMLKKLREK